MDMEKLEEYIEENYGRNIMDPDAPEYGEYAEAVLAMETAEDEMYEAIKNFRAAATKVNMIEIKMSYRQGLKAGLYNRNLSPK